MREYGIVLLALAVLSSCGCVATSGSEQFKTFNVKDFGAMGDGVNDDTPAILATIKAAADAGGAKVLLPPSEKPYLITDQILINASRIHLVGTGATVLLKDGAATGRTDRGNYLHTIKIMGSPEIPVRNVTVQGLTIDANYWGQTGNLGSWQQSVKVAGNLRGIKVVHARNVLVDKVTITRPFVGMTFGPGSHDCEVRDTVVTQFHHDGFGVTPERIDRGASNITFIRCEARDSRDYRYGGPPGTRVKGWEIEEGAQDVKLIDCVVKNTSAYGFTVRPHGGIGKFLTGNVEFIRCRVEKAGTGDGVAAFSMTARSYLRPVRNVRLIDCYTDNGTLSATLGVQNVEVIGGHFGQITIGYYRDLDDPHHDPEGHAKAGFKQLPVRSIKIENVSVETDVRVNAVAGHDGQQEYVPNIKMSGVTVKGNLEIYGSKSLVKTDNCEVTGETRVAEAGQSAWEKFRYRVHGAIPILEKPTLTATRCEKSPNIDGVSDDACWAQAEPSTITHDPETPKQRKDQAFIRACYDHNYLYLLFECLEPNMEKLRVTGKNRDDDTIWSDDNVEIFFHREGDPEGYFRQWMIGASGAFYDGDNEGPSWNSSATVAAKQLSDRHVIEIAIPWKDLGGAPKESEIWSANFTRGQATDWTHWVWSWRYDAVVAYGDASKMGMLVFE